MNTVLDQNFAPNSRVWVYQSNRFFTNDEVGQLHSILSNFTQSWAAHSKPLKATYTLLSNLFIVLMVDENYGMASGCSIDSSVAVIKKINETFGVDLLDRLTISYEENNQIKLLKMFEFQDAIAQNKVNENTIVFNNLVQNKQDFEQNWRVELKNSWHKNLLTLV
ncbi:MAG: hypothetical protein RLZZ414_1701 [Bacteroidota bacterium]|jgi:hypothetical protein